MDTILFAGGDRRTLVAIDYVKRAGYSVKTYAVTDRFPFDGSGISAMVLPFPCVKRGTLNAPMIETPPTLSELIRETGIDKNIPVIGGPIPENPFPHFIDLSTREDLKLRNAVTTVEGAVKLLIQYTDHAIFGSRSLVVGYGAIGKRLAKILSAMGSAVTVAARKEKDRVDGELQGFSAIHTEAMDLAEFDLVINTVPAPLLGESVVSTAPPHTLFLELASAPGGIFRGDPRRNILDGPALPGKVAPVTAGEDLAKTVISILKNL